MRRREHTMQNEPPYLELAARVAERRNTAPSAKCSRRGAKETHQEKTRRDALRALEPVVVGVDVDVDGGDEIEVRELRLALAGGGCVDGDGEGGGPAPGGGSASSVSRR